MLKLSRWGYSIAVVGGFALLLSVSQARIDAGQTGGDAVRVDSDDIGGVVTGPNGPEAGVWVIAETKDLPTKFVKIVVTDDRGRYLLPDLPKANYNVWVRGYGLVDSPKVQAAPGKTMNLTAVVAPNPRAAAEYYPAGYWFSLIRVPEKSEFPGNAPGGNGISPNIKSQAEWIQRLKSGGCTACHQLGTKGTREMPKGARHVPQLRGGVGSAHSVGAGRRADGRRSQRDGQGSRAGDVRRLDRSHRRRRSAARAAAAARRRAQRRHHAVGLGGSEGVPARRGLDRPAQSDAQCQRSHLRIAGAERRLSAGARSGAPHDQPGEAHRARSEHAAHAGDDAAAVAVLGRGSDLDEPEQRPQSDVRRKRTRVDHVRRAAGAESGFLQGGIEPSVGEALSDCERRTPPRRVRSEDEADHAHQHLLRHAPPDVRGGREPDAVDERRRTGRRLAEHEDVRRDARRGEVAGLDRARHGHQRQRQTRRVRRAEPAARSHEGQALRQRLLRRRAGARRIDLGIGARIPRLGRPAESWQRIRPRRRWRKSTSRRCPAIHRAAATSIATASTGPRSRAVTWRASIAASARAPLNGPKATGQHCPEGWTLYRSRCRS